MSAWDVLHNHPADEEAEERVMAMMAPGMMLRTYGREKSVKVQSSTGAGGSRKFGLASGVRSPQDLAVIYPNMNQAAVWEIGWGCVVNSSPAEPCGCAERRLSLNRG